MKVATKFALAFVACAVLSVLVYSWVTAAREPEQVEQTVAEDLAALGGTLRTSLLAVWESDGEARARELVRYTDRDEHTGARWVWLDARNDDATAPRADAATLAGVERGEKRTWIGLRPDGGRQIYAYVPLLRAGERPAALELSRPLDSESTLFWTEVKEQLFASTMVATFATLLAVALSSWIVSRPLARVAEQARRIGAGDLSQRLPVRSSDEVASLVHDLNAMCDQLLDARARADEEAKKSLAAMEQLRHADRLRTVGTLASGIAHELGTPLNVIALRAKMIASGEVPPEEAPESAKIIAGQADRVTRIVRQLLDFARRRTPARKETDMAELVGRTASLLSALAKKSGVQIVVDGGPEPIRANIDGGQIEQALTNLVINAIHAQPNGGKVHVSARRERAAPPSAPGAARECAVIEVRDDGVGIAEENLSRIFEPFFTTKGVGEGTGLGLSVTHGIIEDHEGWMQAASTLGGGSTFTVYLPA